jgi:hypothetical protein
VHAACLVYSRSGAMVPVSTIYTILRNRLYTRRFEWNGKLIQGRHEHGLLACALRCPGFSSRAKIG